MINISSILCRFYIRIKSTYYPLQTFNTVDKWFESESGNNPGRSDPTFRCASLILDFHRFFILFQIFASNCSNWLSRRQLYGPEGLKDMLRTYNRHHFFPVDSRCMHFSVFIDYQGVKSEYGLKGVFRNASVIPIVHPMSAPKIIDKIILLMMVSFMVIPLLPIRWKALVKTAQMSRGRKKLNTVCQSHSYS